jgi:hypothetical protein
MRLVLFVLGGASWLARLRLGDHFEEEPEAAAAVANHLTLPLPGRRGCRRATRTALTVLSLTRHFLGR